MIVACYHLSSPAFVCMHAELRPLSILRSVSFRRHFLVCSRADDAKLEVCGRCGFFALFSLFGYQRCSFVFVSLND